MIKRRPQTVARQIVNQLFASATGARINQSRGIALAALNQTNGFGIAQIVGGHFSRFDFDVVA